MDEDLVGRRARVQAPSDAARPNHARVVLEKSGEVLCIPQRALRRDTSTKPFREAEKRKRASQKESTKKKARKDEPPQKPWLVAGIRVRVGRDGDALPRRDLERLVFWLARSGQIDAKKQVAEGDGSFPVQTYVRKDAATIVADALKESSLDEDSHALTEEDFVVLMTAKAIDFK